jgi:hypothetical protein
MKRLSMCGDNNPMKRPENRKKLSLALKGNKNSLGHKVSKEHKLKLKKFNIGKKMTEEQRKKISDSKYGKFQDEKSNKWKGSKVGYSGLHKWVIKHLGRPGTCEKCGKTGLWGKQIHWANKDHKYKRKLKDWLRLCVKCHRQHDKNL